MSSANASATRSPQHQSQESTRHPGISKVHARGCRWREARCSCGERRRFMASVWSPRDGKRLRQTFKTETEAKLWQGEKRSAVSNGTLRATTKQTVKEAADELLAGMADGSIVDRKGARYKPSTVRTYEGSLRLFVLPELGHLALGKVTREHVNRLVGSWRAQGIAGKTIANRLNPLQVVYRKAIEDGTVPSDPTSGIKVFAKCGRRERVANPVEAVTLLDALPAFERALWATAMYAGLRYGEIRALRWAEVDFDEGFIDVCRSWDQKDGLIDVKTDAGNRKVPLLGNLRRILVEHKLATGRGGDDLVFGREAELVFTHSTVYKRALKAWKKAKLTPIGLHESRHTFASTMVAAGANIKQISVYMGHTDVRTTMNIYAHLFDHGGERFVEGMDAYLAAAQGAR